ncbi:RHS repeat protein [Paenibacillus oralis]|uniref:RHS repeat protein n=1 Tax=Paenibacillus oralis TaxID=2490856 RepID=A0A3P3TA24_9BACL|nr:YraN family protein [Paenibacillus oralis]RRJ54792.1 RHS repeat protein [Paenibacillus oralis]
MLDQKERKHESLTLQDLYLKWPYGQLRLERIKIIRHPGDHARMLLRGLLPEHNGEQIVERASSDDPIGLWGHGRYGRQDYPLFLGQLHQLDLHEVQNNQHVELVVISPTYQLDIERKSRSFQQMNMRYREVIDEVLSPYRHQLQENAFDTSRSIGKLLLQYEETDWEFLERVASHAGAVLTPDVAGHEARIWIGAPTGSGRLKLPEGTAYRIGRKVDSFLTAIVAPNERLQERSFTRCVVRLEQLLQLGDQVELNGIWFTVMGLEAELHKGILEFDYLCALPEGIRQNQLYNPYLVGLAVEGKVIGVAPNRAKVHLDIDWEQDEAEAVWFPYSSPFSHLLHTMPQVGARVKLYFPGKDEDDAMLINSVRTPLSAGGEAAAKANQKMADSTVKSFTTSYGKDFMLGQKDISFTAKEGSLFLSIHEDTGIELHSEQDIIWMAPEEIDFSGFKQFQAIAEEEIIVVGKGGSVIINDYVETSGEVIVAEGRDRQSFAKLTNPEAEQAKIDKEKEGFWDKVQMGLDVLGMLPGVGAVFDVINAGISLARGDFVGAGLSLVCMIPGVGDAFGAARLAGKAASKIGKAVMKVGGEKILKLGKSQMDKVLTAAKKVMGQTDVIQKQVAEKLAKMQDELAERTSKLLQAAAKKTGTDKLLTALNHKVLKNFDRTKGLSEKFCKWGFEPVDLITGRMMSQATDFEFPGPLPLVWERRWISDSRFSGWLGHGVHHVLDMRLAVLKEGIGVLLGDGRAAAFELLHRGRVETFNRSERLTLRRLGHNYAMFEHERRLTYYFAPVTESGDLRGPAALTEGAPWGTETGAKAQAETKPWLAAEAVAKEQAESRAWAIAARAKAGAGAKAEVEADIDTEMEDEVSVPYQLVRVENELGQRIELHYDEQGFLQQVIDSVGRVLDITTDTAGRITKVAHVYRTNPDSPLSERREVLVQYRYNEAGDLTAITDALGQTTYQTYDQHLMTEKKDRNGYSFYWRYDGPTTGARCVHTWGEDGLLEGRIAYFDGYNEVTNSQGHTTKYEYTPEYYCTAITNPLGGRYEYTYSDTADLLSETDEDGRLTQYVYDELGQLVQTIQPDGGSWQYMYSEQGQLLQVTDPEGGSQAWDYDEQGRLNRVVSADGTATTLVYDERHRICEVRNPQDAATMLEYDDHYNLTRMTLPDGTGAEWSYNHRGEFLQTTSPLGANQYFTYDALGRVVRTELPDGNVIKLQYNAYEEVIAAEDSKQRVTFGYTPLGQMTWREAKGKRVELAYNNEEELTAVVNEHGERYELERDANGEIVRETGFDGIVRQYVRGPGRLLERVERPGGRWTAFNYDDMGRITQTAYSDEMTETFKYNRIGALLETANPFATVKLEYDATGRLIQEWRDKYWIASKYDELGNRSVVSSSLGAHINMDRDMLGRISQLQAEQKVQEQAQNGHGTSQAGAGMPWTAQMTYNKLGLEIERLLPGGVVSKWQYDIIGRPERHSVSSGGRESRKRRYTWDINYRLKSLTNELTGKGIRYNYDDFGTLIGASDEFDKIFRMADDVGNLYSSGHRTDRKYGAGGRLLEFQGTKYSYDEEGQLIEKLEQDGSRWRYEYYGNGMMSKVVRPDEQEVVFTYDSLGRRIEKRFNGVVYCYMWDGNQILHEWTAESKQDEHEEKPELDLAGPQGAAEKFKYLLSQPAASQEPDPATLTTWVFEDGTFRPAAKITANGTYSIITDHLGTPVEIYNERGERVWSCELDIYGNVQNIYLKGKRSDCPFRYPGQYEDEETGLYYNRFRYYLPHEGMYTQQDPIGLAGNNPTLYGYVVDPLTWIDELGLNTRLGDWGEKVAAKWLSKKGYKVLGSIQNASNHGFDLIAKEIKTQLITVVEVKTGTKTWIDKKNMAQWTRQNINKIINNTNGRWLNKLDYQEKLLDILDDAQTNGNLKNKVLQINVKKRGIRCH